MFNVSTKFSTKVNFKNKIKNNFIKSVDIQKCMSYDSKCQRDTAYQKAFGEWTKKHPNRQCKVLRQNNKS